jgi:hypothetical protein
VRLKQLALIAVFLLLGQSYTYADDINLVLVELDQVIVCSIDANSINSSAIDPLTTHSVSSELSVTPPSFTEPECNTVSGWDIDPQNTALWAKFSLNIPTSMLNKQQPLSVYVSGKTSSRVYFNGAYLGHNGTPSHNASDEFPGKIDAMFYVPPSLIKPNDNHIVIQFSSHHGFLKLASPINFIGFGSYAGTTAILQQSLGLSFIPLGALVLGALYFLVASFSPLNRQTNVLFLLMCSLAACQLFAEISRALFSYSYPLHDLRLMLIAGFSLSFGICLLYFICSKLERVNARVWTVIGALSTLMVVYFVPGFDPKTALGILVPSCFCCGLIAYQWLKRPSKELLISLLVFLLFIAIVIMTLTRFHDILFYYIITAVLGFLFVQQALKLNREQFQRKIEQLQVAKLQFKLEQNQQKEQPKKININSAGKVELIDSEQIAYCKAAGDYVELYLDANKQILFSGNLKELESQLPSTFLRVHRSYLVNMDYIQSLSSKASHNQKKTVAGGGFLTLKGAYEVPVSRRIMPQVRNAIQ